jgi:arginyl-tRNA synthetase
MNMKWFFAKHLHQILSKNFPELDLSIEDLAKPITTPPDPQMGEMSFPCFLLAKQLKKFGRNLSYKKRFFILEIK